MKIRKKRGYIAIYGNTIPIKIGQFLVGSKKEVRACTYPPFIFFKDESREIPWIVNHELIHFKQVYELLFIGALLLYIYETLYARLFLRMSKYDTYLYSAFEQEAYLNHSNPEYLKHRNVFSIFKYIKNKKKFTVDKDGLVVQIQN